MPQRSKRSLSVERAQDMQRDVGAFHHLLRGWLGSIPLGTPLCVALESANASLHLVSAQLNAAVDGERARPRVRSDVE